MTIPTEPIGSIPRPPELLAMLRRFRSGQATLEQLNIAYDEALKDTVKRFARRWLAMANSVSRALRHIL
jgi:5-methyltetrahydropteroyltriglutamate--homocysteine methyltransferase